MTHFLRIIISKWWIPKQTLKHNNPNSPHIHRVIIHIFSEYLRWYVIRCPNFRKSSLNSNDIYLFSFDFIKFFNFFDLIQLYFFILHIFLLQVLAQSKIADLYVPLFVYQNVIWFYVSMNIVHFVDLFDC